jgi:hypothetical protein
MIFINDHVLASAFSGVRLTLCDFVRSHVMIVINDHVLASAFSGVLLTLCDFV